MQVQCSSLLHHPQTTATSHQTAPRSSPPPARARRRPGATPRPSRHLNRASVMDHRHGQRDASSSVRQAPRRCCCGVSPSSPNEPTELGLATSGAGAGVAWLRRSRRRTRTRIGRAVVVLPESPTRRGARRERTGSSPTASPSTNTRSARARLESLQEPRLPRPSASRSARERAVARRTAFYRPPVSRHRLTRRPPEGPSQTSGPCPPQV